MRASRAELVWGKLLQRVRNFGLGEYAEFAAEAEGEGWHSPLARYVAAAFGIYPLDRRALSLVWGASSGAYAPRIYARWEIPEDLQPTLMPMLASSGRLHGEIDGAELAASGGDAGRTRR